MLTLAEEMWDLDPVYACSRQDCDAEAVAWKTFPWGSAGFCGPHAVEEGL